MRPTDLNEQRIYDQGYEHGYADAYPRAEREGRRHGFNDGYLTARGEFIADMEALTEEKNRLLRRLAFFDGKQPDAVA